MIEVQPVLEAYDGQLKKCAFCGSEKETKVMMRHSSGRILCLCFRGCQHFPEPYLATGLNDPEGWVRVDPWRQKRPQPRLKGLRQMGRDHEQ